MPYGQQDVLFQEDREVIMGERTANVQPGNIGETICGLAEVIGSRRDADPEKSYTALLLQSGEDKVLKKVVEEAVEVALACKDRDHDGGTGNGDRDPADFDAGTFG